MEQLGLGVLINMLGGNEETVKAYTTALKKRIGNVELVDNTLNLWFTDGTGIAFHDAGQSCCESRYMTCDDDLPFYIGGEFVGAELKDAPSQTADGSDHDVQFLEIQTAKGAFTIANHNEHNGYYGGFSIEVRPLRARV